jgi:hypothetical protein
MTGKQRICLTIYLLGAVVAGLAFIHFVWRNPIVLGPFALMIGMTPLVLLFEYSLEVPGYLFWLGAAVAGAGWFVLQPEPPSRRIIKMLILGGGLAMGLCVLTFILASMYYNAGGAAGPTPDGWVRWVRAGTRFGEVGAIVLTAGLFLRTTANWEWDDVAHAG